MLNDWHTWQNLMMNSQQLAFAIMLIGLCLALLVLWNDMRRMRRSTDQLFAQTQKALLELSQQRYAIAHLKESLVKPQATDSEQVIVEDTLKQLDNVLRALPAVDTSATDDKSVDKLKERDILTFIKKALRENKIALAGQPIKSLPQENIRFIEIFSRIKVGTQHIPAGKFLSIAKDAGLLALVDQALLLRTLELVKKNASHDAVLGYFCNLSASTFTNKFLIDKLLKYLEAHPTLSARLIFEMSQEDTFQLDVESRKIFRRLVEIGCRFSMDNVKMMGVDVDRLRDLHLSFVKVNVDAVLKEIEDPAGRRRWQRTRNLLAGNGIEVIVEKVENAKQLDKLQDSGFNYGQGHHFGKPEIIT